MMMKKMINEIKKYSCWLFLFILLLNSYLLHAQTNLNSFDFVVSKDGSSSYNSVQDVLNQIPSGNKRPYKIFIKRGIYKEVVTIDASKSQITLVGEDENNTILQFDNHSGVSMPNGDTLNTWTCASVFVYGGDFQAQHITFSNQAGFNAGQAVALRVEGNRASFFNCRMMGFQDVLFLSGNGVKQYFKDCYIEGTTDFIFGAATALFENCQIYSKKNSHVTAASTNSIIPFGFVFKNCQLSGDTSLHKVTLGRPWSPTASVTYINCWLGSHIMEEGWNNWKNPANELTARFSEYHNMGPGAQPSKRVSWSKQLTDEQANNFVNSKILGAWQPSIK
jgi:pectinesterase